MIARTTINLATRKIITLPQLSPSHSSAKLIQRLVPSQSHVVEYQPIMHLQCSSDLIGEDPVYFILILEEYSVVPHIIFNVKSGSSG
jgi:hypothetical protein